MENLRSDAFSAGLINNPIQCLAFLSAADSNVT